jgi:hypothetical protein
MASIALACIRHGDWEEAERFADAAWELSQTERSEGDNSDELLVVERELKFICALARRFRAGQVFGHLGLFKDTVGRLSTLSLVRLRREINGALAALGECDSRGDDLMSNVRIRSELAAVRMFYAASLLCVRPVAQVRYMSDQIAELLDSAGDDLKFCRKQSDAIEEWIASQPSKRHEPLLQDWETVRVQFQVNIAAREVLRWMLSLRDRKKEWNRGKIPAKQVSECIALLRLRSTLPTIVVFELLLFRKLMIGTPMDMPAEVDGGLPLDRALRRDLEIDLQTL